MKKQEKQDCVTISSELCENIHHALAVAYEHMEKLNAIFDANSAFIEPDFSRKIAADYELIKDTFYQFVDRNRGIREF